KSDPDIESITPVFVGIGEKEGSGVRDDAPAEKTYTILSGIEPESFLVMKPWLRFKGGAGFDGGRWFSPASRTEVVLGFEAAEYEQRKIGDRFFTSITPAGSIAPVKHEFTLVGILERTGTQDDGTVFLSIDSAREFFNRPGQLTIVGIKLKEFSAFKLRDFETRWMKLPEVQVVGLQQVKSTLINLVATAQTMIAAVATIAIVVALIGVINTILMSVYERTGEIGIMKAIGARRNDIFILIWLETLVVCLLGAIVGSLGAWVATGLVEKGIKTLADLGVSGSIVQITPAVIGYALFGTLVLGFIAGIYPAWRAASMRPVEAIREGGGA
ncbi:MAG: FtsX-like permease family protein, partial [Bdellovibrionota bacterium]